MPSLSQFCSKHANGSQFWQGAALYERCMENNWDNLQRADALYTYGYEFLGMAYTAYIHRAIEKIQQYGIDHVVFVAREGYLFKKIYDILIQAMPAGIRNEVTTTYAYLSRMSTFLASAPQLTTREIVIFNYRATPGGLGKMLKYIGLPQEAFASLAATHGLDFDQPITNHWDDPALLAFLNDPSVQSLVKHYHQQSHDNLRAYLEQCHFFGKNRKVALIDIGWDGTIQDNLVRAFNHLPTFPLLHGLYFGRREFKAFLKFSSSFSNGLIFDTRELSVHEKSPSNCVELFEKGAGAPHASTLGYERSESGTVRPIFRSAHSPSRQEEITGNLAVAVMQQGILDFARCYAKELQTQPFSGDSVVPFTQGLITRHMAFPTSDEAHQIAYRLGQHAEDMGAENTRSLVMQSNRFWHALRSGKVTSAKRLLKFSTWNSASLKLMGIPGIQFFYVLRRYLFA